MACDKSEPQNNHVFENLDFEQQLRCLALSTNSKQHGETLHLIKQKVFLFYEIM